MSDYFWTFEHDGEIQLYECGSKKEAAQQADVWWDMENEAEVYRNLLKNS